MRPAQCQYPGAYDLSGERRQPQETMTGDDIATSAGDSRQQFKGGQAVRPEQGRLPGSKQGLLFGLISKLL